MSRRYAFTTIARYTFLEAIRDRLFILLIVGLICAFGLTEFLAELAIIESREIRLSLLGSGLRLFAIVITGLFVITSMVREMNDKGPELVLSQPVPRSSYFFGKLAGFALICLVLVCLITMELAIYSATATLILWSISLFCENLIIIALSILCVFTFSSTTLAFSIVFGFYLLARNIEVIQLISRSPILETNTVSQNVIAVLIDGIAYLLPNFNAFTKTEWLVYQGAGYAELVVIIGQTSIYIIFISGAALFDLYRKEL